MSYEDVLVIKTVWYYYVEDIIQQKISERLEISRMCVIKLLERARQDGVIQFKIYQDDIQRMELKRQLSRTWNLKDTFIVPTPPDAADVNKTIAQTASMYVNSGITKHSFINMGCGDTLSRMLNHLVALDEFPASVVSFTGGVNYHLPNTQSHTSNAKLYLLPAPLLVSSPEMMKAMMQEPSITEVMRMMRLASVTLIGVGDMVDNATILTDGIISKNDFFYLSMRGAVGDIPSHFIDKSGNPVHTDIEDRLISTPLDTLRQLDDVVGVTAEHDKVEAIRTVLRGEYLDIFVTDEETTQALIDGETKEQRPSEGFLY